jgi:SAM-dependent methyltransferase
MAEQREIHQRAKEQFGATAGNYVTSRSHARGKDLEALVDAAGNVETKRVLDIATGGGHTAIALAKLGAVVTASDITPEIIGAAKGNAESHGVALEYVECAAESLPFAAGQFEIVSCRIAPHHFADPAAFVSEVARVLVSKGRFLMIDNISPENDRLADIANTVERRRDPSHVTTYSVSQWACYLAHAGLELNLFRRWTKRKIFHEWASVSHMSAADRDELGRFVLSLDAEAADYLQVETKQGDLVAISHEAALFVADKL